MLSNTQFFIILSVSPVLSYIVVKAGAAGYFRAKARDKAKEAYNEKKPKS